jgi:hypothetical protein
MTSPAQLSLDDSKSVQLNLLQADHESFVAAQVGLNDPRVFEVMLNFPVTAGQGRVDHLVEAWFFVPSALGIGPQTYTRQHFYRDLHSQLRVDTDASAARPEGAMTMLAELATELDAVKAARPQPEALRLLAWKLRLTTAMVRKVLSEHAVRATKALDDSERREHAEPQIREFLEAGKTLVGRVRGLQQQTIWPSFPSFLRDTGAWVDEHLSLCLEYDCIRVLQAVGASSPELARSRRWLLEVCRAEARWRQSQRYPCAESSEEHLVYRSGVLDAFVSESLTLKTPRDEDGKTLAELGSALAAGVAMIMALSLAAFSERMYGVNTTPFAMAVVAGYMLKDRVKDWLKRLFVRRLSRVFADFKGNMVAHQGVVVGRFRETFGFPAVVPPEVLKRRHADSPSEVEIASKPETVLRYEKQVRVEAAKAVSVYGPTSSVTNVLQFNVSELLLGTQPASRMRRVLDGDSVVRTELPNRYHMNIVLVARSAGRVTLGRVRVVMDRNGIHRVELA